MIKPKPGMPKVTFGHQIPVTSTRSLTQAQLDRLNQRLQKLDPHIKGIVPMAVLRNTSPQASGQHKDNINDLGAICVQPGDQLIIPLRDNDTVKRQTEYGFWHQKKAMAASTADAPKHAFSQAADHQPIMMEADQPAVKKSLWQRLIDMYKLIMQSPDQERWRTRYYASGSTVWEMVSSTVTQVQNKLLEEEQNLGISINWPSRPLPYEWRGFMLPTVANNYPLHHNEALTDPAYWTPAKPTHTPINPTYPVVPYKDTERTGPNAFKVGYPYVYETVAPPTGKTPAVHDVTHVPDTTSPRGMWVWLHAEQPVDVLVLLRKLGQMNRQHKTSLLHYESLQKLPLNTTTIHRGHIIRLFMGSQGTVDWQTIKPTLQKELAILKQDMHALGLTVKQVTYANTPEPQLDVDNTLNHARLKNRLQSVLAP
jgi:hypothetical protein